MQEALHPRDDMDRLNMSRKVGERGSASIEETPIRHLKDYIKKNKEGLIIATKNNTNDKRINRTTITRKEILEEKQLYGYFKRQTGKISNEKTWTWLRKRE